jgi:hypothetical protein
MKRETKRAKTRLERPAFVPLTDAEIASMDIDALDRYDDALLTSLAYEEDATRIAQLRTEEERIERVLHERG